MKKYIILGGKPLRGEVSISGSKNASLPILAATLLTKEDVILNNVPTLRDTSTMLSLLAILGKKVIVESNRLIVQTQKSQLFRATYEIVKQMRASIVVLGPLLARWGKAEVSLPGGCAFGPRPIDLHIRGLREMGISIDIKGGYLKAHGRPKGGRVDLLGQFGPSVLATDNIMMASSLASGSTVIENAAREPETQDLAGFLNAMGAQVKGAGESIVTIAGVKALHGCEYTVIQDRIEAATYACAVAITGGEVSMKYDRPAHLESMIRILRKIGVGVTRRGKHLRIQGRPSRYYRGFNVHTMPYPHFPTDMQPLFMALASVISDVSTLTESIYPNRFNHVPELIRLGAHIRMEESTAIVKRKRMLSGASVQSSDLRAGAALVIAGLAARGKTEVHRVYHIERGYEAMPEKLGYLGARLTVARSSIV